MSTVLVTGANGFIGHNLVQRLRAIDLQVHLLRSQDGDIADANTLQSVQNRKIRHVIHLASRTFVPDSWREPAEFQRVNVGGTMNVLEYCRKKAIPLTYVSAYLYGTPRSLPVRETDELRPNNPYALSKCMAERACRFYADYYDLAVTIIRPFNIYGPGQKSHFLIPEIVSQVQAGQAIRLKDLAPKRDYLYIDDLVDALALTLTPHSGLRMFNVGCGQSMSVAEIVATIQAVAGTDLPVFGENTPRKNEIMDVYADISAIRDTFGWRPRVELKDGIKAMMNGVPSL